MARFTICFPWLSIAAIVVEAVAGFTGVEGRDMKKHEANVVREDSLNAVGSGILPSSVVAQQDRSNAVSVMMGEVRRSANPMQTASSVAKSWQQRVDKQIGSDRKEIEQFIKTATKAMDEKTHEAEELVRVASESWSKDQAQIKKTASSAVETMQNNPDEKNFNNIWDEGHHVADSAMSSAEAIRHTVESMADKLTKTKAELLALSTRASEAIETVGTRSQVHTEAMADQLVEFGKLASGQLDVPERAAKVLDETGNTAVGMKTAGSNFIEESKASSGNLQGAGYKAAAAVEALATKAKASGDHRADIIADGAQKGKDALHAALETWKQTSMNALKPIYENFGQDH